MHQDGEVKGTPAKWRDAYFDGAPRGTVLTATVAQVGLFPVCVLDELEMFRCRSIRWGVWNTRVTLSCNAGASLPPPHALAPSSRSPEVLKRPAEVRLGMGPGRAISMQDRLFQEILSERVTALTSFSPQPCTSRVPTVHTNMCMCAHTPSVAAGTHTPCPGSCQLLLSLGKPRPALKPLLDCLVPLGCQPHPRTFHHPPRHPPTHTQRVRTQSHQGQWSLSWQKQLVA